MNDNQNQSTNMTSPASRQSLRDRLNAGDEVPTVDMVGQCLDRIDQLEGFLLSPFRNEP